MSKNLRKQRLNNKQVYDYANWYFNNNDENMKLYTAGKVQQMYKEEFNIIVSTTFINEQRKRWIIIDGKLYDKNKPWTFPKS